MSPDVARIIPSRAHMSSLGSHFLDANCRVQQTEEPGYSEIGYCTRWAPAVPTAHIHGGGLTIIGGNCSYSWLGAGASLLLVSFFEGISHKKPVTGNCDANEGVICRQSGCWKSARPEEVVAARAGPSSRVEKVEHGSARVIFGSSSWKLNRSPAHLPLANLCNCN